MARRLKPGITFYRMDSGHVTNKKVRLLLNEFDSDGYYIWSCLIDYGYKTWGFYFDTNDKDELELFASEYCRKKLSLIREVINGCIRRGLFSKAVFDMSGVLTSDMMQEVFLFATHERRKKGSSFEIQHDWLLLDFSAGIPQNIVIVPGNNSENQGNNSQTKTETETETETKTRQEFTAAGKPPAAGKGKRKKSEEAPEPHWNELVKTWFDFNVEKFLKKNPGADPKKGEPSFHGTPNPRTFKRIIGLLKERARKEAVEWTSENAVARLLQFLASADQGWLAQHFLLDNLLKQFDLIVTEQQDGNQNRPTRDYRTHRAVITGTAQSAGTL